MEDMSNHDTATRQTMIEIDTKIAEAKAAYQSAASNVAFNEKNNRSNEADNAKLVDALDALREAELDYAGWSRFFIVPQGHIHSSLDCSTCNKYSHSGSGVTSFAWLTELAGLESVDAVEIYGAILCTVCFPDAPVEHTGGENKVEAAEKAAAKTEREINRIPEVKKMNAKISKIDSVRYNISSCEWSIERYERSFEDYPDAGEEAFAEWNAEIAAHEAKIVKFRKQIVAAEKAMAPIAVAAAAAKTAAGF